MYHIHILIRGGRVFDGDRFLDGDVALTEDGIAAIGRVEGFRPDFEFDAAGCTVLPGLCDLHTHLFGISSPTYETDGAAVFFPNGVTAAADAGAERLRPDAAALPFDLKVFVSVPVGRDRRPDFSKVPDLLAGYGDLAAGLKVFFDRSALGLDPSVEPLAEICDYAHKRGLRVMVHAAGSPAPLADLLAALSAGDICTHIYHGVGHTSAEDGFDCLRAARARGVILDTGLAGCVHTDFEIARAAIKVGAAPDTVSTDVTSASAFRRGGNYGLLMAMSMMRHLGLDEEALFRAVTSTPSDILGFDGGRLRVGGPSDLTVLREGPAPCDMTDKNGHRIRFERGYRCMLTVRHGRLMYRR